MAVRRFKGKLRVAYACILLTGGMNACGLSNFISRPESGAAAIDSSGSGSTGSNSPNTGETPVTPPVPVIGSYLTTVFFDENFEPYTSLKLIANHDSESIVSSEKEKVMLPPNSFSRGEAKVTLDYENQKIRLSLILPPDLESQLESPIPAGSEPQSRMLGVLLPSEVLEVAKKREIGLGGRYTPATLSLVKVADTKVKLSDVIRNLAITSHKNNDNIFSEFEMRGTCFSGDEIEISGDVQNSVSQNCDAAGTFAFTLRVTPGVGVKRLIVTQAKSEKGDYTSRQIFLRSLGCPLGFIKVPASRVEGLGNALVNNNHSDWWLNSSKDFCVMKYPAKVDPVDLVSAVSQPKGLPWTSISQPDAAIACSALGENYRLISNMQWQTIARNVENVASNWSGNVVGNGVLAIGHSDNFPSTPLESGPDVAPYFGTKNDGSDKSLVNWEQKRTLNLSNDEVIWDFAGNVWQWVSDSLPALGLNPGIGTGWGWVDFDNVVNFPISPDNVSVNRLLLGPAGLFTSLDGMGKMYLANANYLVRGGDYKGFVNSGIYSGSSYTVGAPHVGFRCVFRPD